MSWSASSLSSLHPLFSFPRISHLLENEAKVLQDHLGAEESGRPMGASGILTQRGKSIADLWDSFLPEKATLDSRGLGDTTGHPPERVNGESRGTRRDRQSRQADTTCLTPDDPSERSIHTSAQVSPVVLWRQPPVSVFLCSVSPSSLQLCSESIPPSLPAPS